MGRKAASFRGTTQIRALGRALEAPVTEGGPAVSPRRLPGEPNGAARMGFQPAAHPLLARRDRYFPVHREFEYYLFFIAQRREKCKRKN